MANSVVKVTDIKDDELNDSLLLLVGEDGTVTPDQDTVETFLKQRNGPTSIQIMKINKSEKHGIDITVDNVTYMPNAINEEVVKTEFEMDEIARNLYNFKLDHDYTPLTSPRRANSPQEEDELAKTLSILDGPYPEPTVPPAVSSEPPPLILSTPPKIDRPTPKVKIIQSITITPANLQKTTINKNTTASPQLRTEAQTTNVAVTNSTGDVAHETSTPVITASSSVAVTSGLPSSTVAIVPATVVETPSITTPVTSKTRAKVIKTESKIIPRPERAKPAKPKTKIVKEVVEEESDEDFNDEDFDFDIDDDENDSDFDFEEELKAKQTPKRVSRRTKSESKTPPKTPRTMQKSKIKENKETKEMKQETVKVETKVEKGPEKSVEKVNDQKPDQPEVKPVEKKPPKKEKKVPKPILDDFALFSTPDIIRRVGGKEPTTPITPEVNSPTKPGKITNESRSKSINESPQYPTKHSRNSIDSKVIEKTEKEKNLNHQHSDNKSKERRTSMGEVKTKRTSIDEKSNKTESKLDRHSQEYKKAEKPSVKYPETVERSEGGSEDIPSAEDIRSIIMNEDTKSFTTSALPMDLNNSDPQNMDPNNLNLDATGLDLDPTLLDNLNNDEISEDILYQVAQSLVSNPELQNAIDKGINDGVLDPMGVEQNLMPNQTLAMQESNDNVVQKGTQIVRPDGRIVVIPPIERPTTRSRNKRKEEVKPPFKPVHKPLDDEHVSGNELDSSNEEDESEDDPNKLWCICNQPHNNRFMICCDTCEEWYHGKCVNITKAMGQQMEAEGKEWICLFCKDPMLKRPQAAARRVRKASRNSRASTDSTGSSTKKADNSTNTVPCVVCQKPARKNSIYCSETCILAHAQGIERVVVFERSTGNMLTGNKAPSAANLEQWLKEHPGYEVVRSGGKVVTAKAGSYTQSKLKLVKNQDNEGVSLAVQKKGVNLGVLKHSPKHPQQHAKTPLKATITGFKVSNKQVNSKEPKTKLIQPQPISKPVASTPPSKSKTVQTTLTKTAQVAPNKPKPPSTKEKSMPSKTPKSRQQEPPPPTPQPKPQENIRENVQKTVFEQLTNRLKGNTDLKLTADEVKNISTEIESQLYKCFGDTGQKYRNKYRSLIFNIKDAKNQTLWRRICEKSINPYQLVRLSPDDLASQELAMWREQEAKHQLDMIKKSELELLNCNRQYVLKTHKGEQVLEDDRADKVDNTEVIKSLTEGSTLDSGEAKRDHSKERDKKGSSKHSHKDKDRDRDRDKEKKSNKDKEHRGHRSSSKDKDRDRDRSRKRSRSRDRSSRHSDHKKRSRSRDRDRDRHRKSSHKSSRHKKDIISTTEKLDKKSKEILEQLVDNKIVPPLEDRLWKHVPQEDILPAPESDSDHEPSSTVTIPTPPRSQESDEFSSSQASNETKNNLSIVDKEKDLSPVEERSTSPPPQTHPAEIWRGTINMIDVAQISITAHEVSGDCTGLGKELQDNLDIVGRISPDTVWDYIGKMKCSNSKIISLLRLNATNIEEKMPYLALYSYLSSRTRLGVVKSVNKAVKDFYILPLAPQKPIPQALLPLNGPGFEESRPALLLGIIVRDKRKRPYAEPVVSPAVLPKRVKVETPPLPVPPPVVPPRSYTPPPPLKDPRLKLPLPPPLPASAGDEDDEPYSPEDSDPDAPAPLLMVDPAPAQTTPDVTTDAIIQSPSYPAIPGLSSTPTLPSSTLEIQRQMEELNKKIEMQKSEITSMTQNIVSASSEIGTSALANIALPSNLQQILDSIKTIGENTESATPPPQESSQTDLTIPLMIPKTFTRPLSGTSQRLDMPSDTIPLNLPSKPKIKPHSVNSPLLEDKGSVLGSLSEEDLIRKAAEMLGEDESKSRRKPEKELLPITPPSKRSKIDISLPPVPGLEDEIL